MATLTKSTGTVTLSGAVEKVTFPAVYGWVWVKNMSDADMFVGLSDGVSAGADGVLAISAGECGRVQTDGLNSIYLMGTGNALVVAQNYADCPFKVGGKGGEIPDLSAYAKKTDIPTELPANGGTAYTISEWGTRVFQDVNNAELGFSAACSDVGHLNAPNSFWSTVLTTGSNSTESFRTQFAFPWSVNTKTQTLKYRVMDNGVWNDWIEIYTSGNKPYVTGSVTVAANTSYCATNHGFMPSGVVWWDGNASGVAVSFNETQFVIEQMSTSARTVNYLIFK